MNTVAEIERELSRLRSESMAFRTSAMTHVAWAPPEWQDASRETLERLAERHPSRTLLLFPREDGRNELDADVSLHCFTLPELEGMVSTEVVEVRLHGDRAHAPASVVLPLALPDLPMFLRWRGRPPFGADELEQLVDVVDRLVVDSREWPDAPASYRELATYFERTAVSDIVWTRTQRWRRAIAQLWPLAPSELHVVGPAAEAALLAGWLRSRLDRRVELRLEEAERIELLELDGEEVVTREERFTPSDLLSIQLDRFSRDPVYEAAVTSAVR
jgi:glucose-6-phosphate dehydrogenase assembly protein OpcA